MSFFSYLYTVFFNYNNEKPIRIIDVRCMLRNAFVVL